MTTTFKLSTLFLACSLVLTGCGGGGSSDSGSANNSNAGGNNTNQVSAGSQTGVFLDSPVAGISYTTSSGYTGTTDGSGHYFYNTGETITFKLGTLVLGSAPATSLITPIDLANTNTDVSVQTNIQNNLLVLLQSLNTTKTANVITITPDSIANISSSLDLTVDPTTFATNLGKVISTTPVSLTTALTNFQNALSNNSSTSTAPLQTAKDFVKNTNTIISSANQIMLTYQPANLTGTAELGYATNAVSALALNAYQITNGQSTTLNTTQIQTILNNSIGDQTQFSNVNNLTVTTTASGAVNISGSFTITPESHQWTCPSTPPYTCTEAAGTPITVTVSQFGITTNANTNSSNFNFTLNANSSITATTTKGINATVIANSNSTITATYPSAITLNLSKTTSNTQNDTNPIPQTGSVALQNIKLTSGSTTLNLNNFKISGQTINTQNTGSSSIEQTLIPTSLAFNGSIQQNQNTANVSGQIQLSGVSSTQTYTVDQNGIPTAATIGNAAANFSLAVSANILAGSTPHAFRANFVGSLTGLSAAQSAVELTLDKTSLMGSVTATAATTAQPESVNVTLIDPNGASVNIPNILNFTTANIMVNGAVQGTISKTSSSIYQAKFTDNSIVVIAP